jgi:hypothetical protein
MGDMVQATIDITHLGREAAALSLATQRLQETFPQLPPEQVRDAVQAQYHRFDGSKIRDFVPIFVERNTREELARRVATV